MNDLLTSVGVALGSTALLAVMFIPLERAWRAREQPIVRAHLTLDLLFLAGQYLLWNAASLTALFSVHHVWLAVTPLRLDSLPAPLQVLLAVALGDLCMYAFHRACHAVPLLWRFHAVHHTSTELDWVAAYREHPLDGVLTQLAMNLPAIALGLSFELFAPLVVFRGVWAIVVHSNTRLPLGPLKWLIGAPELHRDHHRATDAPQNFANLAPWVDVLFGTHREPHDETYPLGIPHVQLRIGAPLRTYLALLGWPAGAPPAWGALDPRRAAPVGSRTDDEHSDCRS